MKALVACLVAFIGGCGLISMISFLNIAQSSIESLNEDLRGPFCNLYPAANQVRCSHIDKTHVQHDLLVVLQVLPGFIYPGCVKYLGFLAAFP